MKGYTNLEQSKKLAEILPLESADMYYHYNEYEERHYPKVFLDYETAEIRQEVLELKRNDPCWSLAALLSVLPYIDFTTPQLVGTPKTLYRCQYNDDLKSHAYDNPIDACVAMIEKLHELKML